jgi:hypothetical protein
LGVLLEPGTDLVSAKVGHMKVKKYEVRLNCPCFFQGLRSRPGGMQDEFPALEKGLLHGKEQLSIVYEQQIFCFLQLKHLIIYQFTRK